MNQLTKLLVTSSLLLPLGAPQMALAGPTLYPQPVLAQSNSSELTDEEASVLGGVILLVVFGLGLMLYLLPWGIAMMRSSKYSAVVFVINLFTGWSFIGWVIALVVAVLPQD